VGRGLQATEGTYAPCLSSLPMVKSPPHFGTFLPGKK
jgi:hypothetical protein